MEWQHLRLQRPFEITLRPEGSNRKRQEKINEATHNIKHLRIKFIR